MLSIFLQLTLSAKPFSLYDFVPGNWTHIHNRKLYNVLIDVDEDITSPTNTTIVYSGFFNKSKIVLFVDSPTSLIAQYGQNEFKVNLTLIHDWVSHDEIILPNGNHLSIGTFSPLNCEIAVADKENNDFIVYGFRKIENLEYKPKDFLIPTAIAVGILVICKYVLHIEIAGIF